MNRIVIFELKKILSKRINQIAMFAGAFLIAISAFYAVKNEEYCDKDGSIISGAEAIQINRSNAEDYADMLTEKVIRKAVKAYQNEINNGASEDQAYIDLVYNDNGLYPIIARNYTMSNEQWSMESVAQIDIKNDKGFYNETYEKINNILNTEYSYGSYTPEEKEYWSEKSKDVTTPFKWGYMSGWNNILNLFESCPYLLVVIGICISPVFADEYKNKSDALLLTSRYGKNKLITAKIIASVIFAVVYMSVVVWLGILVIWGMFGASESDISVQLWNNIIPYNYTILQTVIIAFGIIVLETIAMTGITLCLSSRVKSSYGVLIIDMVLLLVPAFLAFSKTSRLWNRILYLTFPKIEIRSVLAAFNSYQFGGTVLSYMSMILVVYILISVVAVLFTGGGFKNHQVGAR